MAYKKNEFSHRQVDKVGVLITNLGTPQAPTAKALKIYLKEFLSDPRVVEFPRLLWWIVLNCIILQIRPRRSAEAYRSVWTDEGSPLAIHTANQADALRKTLEEKYGDQVLIEWGMRYGQPSIPNAIDKLINAGARKLVVLPLYPQYSGSTSGSTFDALAHDFMARRWIPELRFINCYHDEPVYIKALAESVKNFWKDNGKADKLIFSYHGVPQRYLHNGDPYHCQCHVTSRLLANELSLNEDQYLTSFQSRFGREPWLQPYTDETLKALGKQGCKSLQVVCPGFSSDCLETIEEIGMENRDYFLESGGEKFEYIPALNSESFHIDALETLITKNLGDWIKRLPNDGQVFEDRESRFQTHTHNLKK